MASRYRTPGPEWRGGVSSVRRSASGTRTPIGRPGPDSAWVSMRNEPRRSSVCTWVHGTYGGADPIDTVGTNVSTSSRPVRAVTDSRVPTTRHTALAATASATPGWPITPVTPSADEDPKPGVPATSLASGTVATRARNTARSCSSSARASSRATCSPTMMVTGPFAPRSACTIACGLPIIVGRGWHGNIPSQCAARRYPGSRRVPAERPWAAATPPGRRCAPRRSPGAAPKRCRPA